MGPTGCALLVINVSTFINNELENRLDDQLQVTVTLKEEGTGESVANSLKQNKKRRDQC